MKETFSLMYLGLFSIGRNFQTGKSPSGKGVGIKVKYKAVIIDDEIWTRKVIRSLGEWETYGIEIAGEASDGEYGLELIRQVNPDIILTDVCMPHMNGLEQIKQLREENSSVQVIFISGYDDYSYVRNAMKLGAVDYLLKPVKPEELNNQLMNCTQRLQTLENAEKEKDFSMSFLKEEWAGGYYQLRDSLAESISSGNQEVLNLKLEEISLFLQEKMGDMPDKGSMISIYYMLLNLLQRFILSRGYGMEDIFEGRNTTFVFEEGCTPKEMISFISGLYLHGVEKIQERMKGRTRLDTAKVQKYLQENYKEGITLEGTAEEFFVSKEYLSKAFKAETGKGFQEYLTGLRMEKAKELILNYKVPIKDAGEMVGYVDQSHFYKTFKKYFGMTPGEMKPV